MPQFSQTEIVAVVRQTASELIVKHLGIPPQHSLVIEILNDRYSFFHNGWLGLYRLLVFSLFYRSLRVLSFSHGESACLLVFFYYQLGS
jgi:hypothetical protein